MTRALYAENAYRRDAPAQVISRGEGIVTLDESLFYPTGGGQPGDRGHLDWPGGSATVIDTRKGEGGAILLVLADGDMPPSVGTALTQHVDWDLRHRHMRMHTALHLLSVVIPLPVTGGQIGAEKSRLDFDMADPPGEKDALAQALNDLIERDLKVSENWITEAELDANPGLVKTLRVAPPRGAGRIRLVRIGEGTTQVDLQPCGGTHVARTGEIGPVRIGKIEKKGKTNRRVAIHLDG